MIKAIYSLQHRQDVVAFRGLVRVVTPDWAGGTPFRDKALESPTWGDLLEAADRQLAVTGDDHHIFLEGAEQQPEVFGIGAIAQPIELIFGS